MNDSSDVSVQTTTIHHTCRWVSVDNDNEICQVGNEICDAYQNEYSVILQQNLMAEESQNTNTSNNSSETNVYTVYAFSSQGSVATL